MSLSKLKVIGTLQTLDSNVVQESHDLAQTYDDVTESSRGEFSLARGGSSAKQKVLMNSLANARVALFQCDATFTVEWPVGTTLGTFDKFAVLGFPTTDVSTSFAVTMISSTTALPFKYVVGATA